MSMLDVRPFAEPDRAGLRELFGRAGEGSPTESLWGHSESEATVYLYPYLEHGTVLVAVDGERPVGYLAGCLDTTAFPSENDRMAQAIRRYRLVVRPGPLLFFGRAMVDMAGATVRREPTAGEFHDARWPAHLHINVAPEARGTGAADELTKQWLERLSVGCHLQTLCENTRAVRFFERMGFAKHGPTPPVPGVRYHGKRVHQQTMVWHP